MPGFTDRSGPSGFRGATPRRFRERTLDVTTQVREYQVGLEPWAQFTPDYRVYQVGLEVWASSFVATNDIRPRGRIGPKGLVNSISRQFKEKNKPLTGIYATEVQEYQVGLEPWVSMNVEYRAYQVGLEVWAANLYDRRHVQVFFL